MKTNANLLSAILMAVTFGSFMPQLQGQGSLEDQLKADARMQNAVAKFESAKNNFTESVGKMSQSEKESFLNNLTFLGEKESKLTNSEATFLAQAIGFKDINDFSLWRQDVQELHAQYPELEVNDQVLGSVYTQIKPSGDDALKRGGLKDCDEDCVADADTVYWTVAAGCVAAAACLLCGLGCAAVNAALYHNNLSRCCAK